MNYLSLEIVQLIYNFLNFEDQIKFRLLKKNYYEGLRIYNFYHIPEKYKKKLNDNILKNFIHVKYLDASYNSKITDINYMTNLQILNAEYASVYRFAQ